jgi:hypothetical protein
MATATSEAPILVSGPRLAKILGLSYPSFKRLVQRRVFSQIRIPQCAPKYMVSVALEELSQYIQLSKTQESKQ